MVGFLWQSLIFLPRTAKTFQNLGKKKNVEAQIKIKTYFRCCGWIPLKYPNISATHCQVFQNLDKRNRNVKAAIKIQTYIFCYGWIPSTIINNSATRCQVFSKSLQEKKMSRLRSRFKLTFIAMVGFLWKSSISLPRTAKIFQNLSKINRNVKRKIKNQIYLHCYGCILSTLTNVSSTHCQVFSKSWQEKKKCSGGDKDSNLHSLLWSDSIENP